MGIALAVQHCLDRGLTFVAFGSGTDVQLWVSDGPGLLSLSPAELDDQQDLFVIVPFDDPQGQVYGLKSDHRLHGIDGSFDLSELANAVGAAHEELPTMEEWDQQGYTEAVNEALRAFRPGPLSKVVLSRSQRVEFPKERLGHLFGSGLQRYPDAFVCILNCPEFGTWLGASPELLLSASEGAVRIDAIAGTLPIQGSPADPDEWGTKERDEQEQVTRGILETLRTLGAGNITCSGPEVFPAGNIAHLRTRVQAVLSDTSPSGLLHALHPTAAVCGRPTSEAMRFIRSQEPCSRGLYAGSWGPWQVDGHTSLYVNIRCAQWRGDVAYIHVGGGITQGSDPDREWQETEYKAGTWTDLMKAASLRIS